MQHIGLNTFIEIIATPPNTKGTPPNPLYWFPMNVLQLQHIGQNTFIKASPPNTKGTPPGTGNTSKYWKHVQTQK